MVLAPLQHPGGHKEPAEKREERWGTRQQQRQWQNRICAAAFQRAGPKTYIYTVYALSAPVELTVKPSEVTRAVLLDAMKDRTLATAELKVVYTRPAGATGVEARPTP